MSEPTRQEIEDKRDDAAQKSIDRAGTAMAAYTDGVRDALAWVLDDGDEPEL